MKKEIIKINKINKAFRENPVLIDLDFQFTIMMLSILKARMVVESLHC